MIQSQKVAKIMLKQQDKSRKRDFAILLPLQGDSLTTWTRGATIKHDLAGRSASLRTIQKLIPLLADRHTKLGLVPGRRLLVLNFENT